MSKIQDHKIEYTNIIDKLKYINIDHDAKKTKRPLPHALPLVNPLALFYHFVALQSYLQNHKGKL